eukprot:TRINITY_DN587_c0_g2_i1.p1 TRINITY_DN587_c0_g2~~TRINITY_DN587_c0_g2_i1.p1  ORF type:complete len:251 (-),score=102.06 TRINITY_DN587_c0_g2_i1:80-832(-)
MTTTLVLVRHGESTYNKENRFCGWFDADLSEKGIEEAKTAGKDLKANNFVFDVAFTSLLKRAIKTLFLIQDEVDQHWIPVHRNWRLNERMYGGLQGLNKAETSAKHGEQQVQIWRRSFDIPPPPIELTNPHYPGNDPRYRNLDAAEIPLCESLSDTIQRFLPVWHQEIAPQLKQGKRVLICAHGNSLRALVKYLDNLSEEQVIDLNIPTAIPLVYQLDSDLKPISHYYLADEAKVQAAIHAVASQAKPKN